jgi:phospholipid/cholesterol/gamma-HCH transport system ATP-binding protein
MFGRDRVEAEPEADNPGYEIEVRDLHKSFDSVDVLTGLDLLIAENAITTVLGPSGVGKSVLLKHFVGLLEPDDGEVLIGGQDIWKMSPKKRNDVCSQIGVLFQDGAMFGSMNIFDNTALPLRENTRKSEDEIQQIVMERLTAVGLADAVQKMPSEISGGMRKRAGFARALVTDPPIVLFDEPDSGLDPVRTNLLNDVILKVHNERPATYVLVTHDISTARKVSDYVALVWEGKAIHQGQVDEVFSSTDPFVRQFVTGDTAGPLGMD